MAVQGNALANTPSAPEAVWPPLHWLDAAAAVPAAATANGAMVATANAWATAAALQTLREGGGAIDAAVSAQFVLNVVEPQSSGLGGGCYLLYLPTGAGEPVVVDGRERAPGAADERLFLDANGTPVPYYPDRVTGGRPVGVPGTLAALWLAHQRWGRLPWAQLLEAGIDVAERGFPVSRRLSAAIREQQARLTFFPETAALFLTPRGDALEVGAWLRMPDLADTFRAIARHGAAVFYEGDIGADVSRAVRESPLHPGRMTEADVRAYRAVVRRPVSTRYRGADVFGVGPPSSGGTTLIEMLNILSGFDLPSLEPGSAPAVHLLLEAGKLAFADRNRYVADPDFVPVPVDSLLSRTFAARRARAIRPTEALAAPLDAADLPERGETTHVSIRDAHGGLLAMTTTIEQNFGSGILVPGRGFLLNNQLSDFEATPLDDEGRAVANRVSPGKRPRTSMSPTIVTVDGEPFLSLGSPGGSRIIGIVACVLVNVLDWGMDVQEAIDFPRALNRGRPESELESLFFDDAALERLTGRRGVVERLREWGHRIPEPQRGFRGVGGVQAVSCRPDVASPTGVRLAGGADSRREGSALGF